MQRNFSIEDLKQIHFIPTYQPTFVAFQAWTFAEAKRNIYHVCKMNQGYQVIEDEDANFLMNISERISAIDDLLRVISTLENPITSQKKNKNFTDDLVKYHNQIAESLNVVSLETFVLHQKLMDKYTHEKKNKEYKHFLAALINCCFGVAEWLKVIMSHGQGVMNSVQTINHIAINTYNGIGRPFSQSLEPQKGAMVSKTPSKTVEFRGGCSGHVYDWIYQIFQGSKKLTLTYDIRTHDAQIFRKENKEKLEVLKHERLHLDTHLKKGIEHLMNVIENGNIFELNLIDITNQTPGHAIGIRYIKAIDAYEFFDPNYGIYLFNHKADFSQFMSFMVSFYFSRFPINDGYLNEVKSNGKNIRSFVTQPFNANPKNDELPLTVIQSMFNDLNDLSKNTKSSMKELQNKLMNILPELLAHTHSIETLQEIEKHLFDTCSTLIKGVQSDSPQLFENKASHSIEKQLTQLLEEHKQSLLKTKHDL